MLSRIKPPTFMDGLAFHARYNLLLAYVPLAQAHPDPATLTGSEPDLGPLFADARHGNIERVEPAVHSGRPAVAVSIQGRNPRLFMPLDYVALDLVSGYGLHLTIQKTTGDPTRRRDYPRITSPGPNGWVFQVLRIIADAQPGQVVKQQAIDAAPMDHHYLGRDGLVITTDDAERAGGKRLRHTTRGRADLIRRAEECFAANVGRFDLPPSITPEAYAQLLTLAFGLADWRHGRLDGQLPALLRPYPTDL